MSADRFLWEREIPKPEVELDLSYEDILTHVARLQEIKKRRPAVSELDSLQKLATYCILVEASRFLTFDTVHKGHANDPFAFLPKGVVKELLEDPGLFDFLESKSAHLCLVLQLLNTQITECYNVQCTDMSEESQNIIFRHLLQNCPKMEKIEVASKTYEDTVALPRSCPKDIFQMMGNQWPNLTSLKLTDIKGRPTKTKENSDVLIEMISRHLPALRDLEVVLSMETLTMKGVKHLSQMNKLKHLSVILEDCRTNQHILLIVCAVGELPSIEQFSIIDTTSNERDYSRFVDVYGQQYSGKKLILKSICIARDLDKPWPECLTLEELNIHETQHSYFSTTDGSDLKYSNLLAGKCFPTKVCIKGVETAVIYHLVEKFGPAGLTDLKINAMYNRESMDVCRVLAACPKLENLNIYSNEFHRTSRFKDSPDYFQNLESFRLAIESDSEMGHLRISKLYRNYLIGSRRFLKKLTLQEEEDVDDVLWALKQERRTCLDQVEEIVFDTANITYSGDFPKKALTVVLLLAQRSPNLEKVELEDICEGMILPPWYQTAFQDLGIKLTAYGIEERSFESYSDDDDDDLLGDSFGSDQDSEPEECIDILNKTIF